VTGKLLLGSAALCSARLWGPQEIARLIERGALTCHDKRNFLGCLLESGRTRDGLPGRLCVFVGGYAFSPLDGPSALGLYCLSHTHCGRGRRQLAPPV